jgi:hypothetical protein
MKNNLELESGTSNASMIIEEGLDYILSHFEGQRLWPRTISTRITENRQVTVRSREEALARFTQANFLDCRISAYPSNSELSSFVGVNLEIAPNIIMIDLDRETFKTQRAFEMALNKTLRKVFETIISEPTVMWSGSGYHIYLVLDAFVLEEEDAFNNSEFGSNPSQKFLRFAEWFLSNGKCDPQHYKTVSFRNCMLRIPGSVNSKNGQKVRIVQRWNGFRPNIRLLLGSFHAWLVDSQIKEESYRPHRHRNIDCQNCSPYNIQWMEHLLQIPIADHRKFAIWRVLAPYLVNVKKLSFEDAFDIMKQWLEKCDEVNKLNFYPRSRINEGLNGASHGFFPISHTKLRTENEGLYTLLQENGVFR